MKYIDADRLKAEIEKRKQIHFNDYFVKKSGNPADYGASNALAQVLSLIDSLQQEQPEVDLENEINRFLSNATMMNKGEWKGKYPISEMGFGVVARHFFNLGLNARKEENK